MEMMRAMDVSFTRVMTSFESGGTMRLTICSSVMWRNVCGPVRPSTCAASCWPFGTPSMPARKISEK